MSVPRKGVLKKLLTEGRCRTCGATAELTRHHLVPESWFRRNPEVAGRHNPSNIAPLCRYCHQLVDSTRRDPMRTEKRRRLRATLTRSELRFIRRVRGDAWLDRNYPESTVNHGKFVAAA